MQSPGTNGIDNKTLEDLFDSFGELWHGVLGLGSRIFLRRKMQTNHPTFCADFPQVYLLIHTSGEGLRFHIRELAKGLCCKAEEPAEQQPQRAEEQGKMEFGPWTQPEFKTQDLSKKPGTKVGPVRGSFIHDAQYL